MKNNKSSLVSEAGPRLGLAIGGSIFLGELLIMLLLEKLSIVGWQQNIVDAFLLVVICFPAVYFFILIPLKFEASKHEERAKLLLCSEEKLRSITDSAQDTILMMDPRGNISYWNPAAEKMLGYRREEALGMNLHQLLAPSRFHAAQADAFQEFLKTGKGSVIGKTRELAALGKDGVEIPVELSLSAIHREDGWHAIGIIRDITERIQAETELRKFQRAIEQSPVTVLITDCSGAIEYANPEFLQMTGYTTEEALGKTPRILKSGELSSQVYEELWLDITSGKEWRGEFHNKKKNGELYWESASISPIRDAQGVITHYLAVKEDITERKRLEEELKKNMQELEVQARELQKTNELINHLYHGLEMKNRDLEKMSGLKDDFVSIVAHELRNPLAVLWEAASLILDGLAGPIEPQQKPYLEMIKRTADRLGHVTTDLLDLAKIEAGKIVLNFETMDLLSMARQSCEGIRLRAQKKGLTVSEDFPAEGKFEISADFDKLSQVMINLLSNAFKFTEKGGITVEIKDLGAEVRCAVKDTGRGISEENLSRLFSKFEQFGKPMLDSEKGSGLGLVITRSIVIAHGGRIWVESEEGKGASFIFTLPKHQHKKKLGEILIEEKALTPEQLTRALLRQKGQGAEQ